MRNEEVKITAHISGFLIACMLFCGVASAENKDQSKASGSIKESTKETPPEQKPLIVVNGETLTSQSYIYFLQGNPTIVSRATSSEDGKAEALRELVASHLLKKALLDEGILKMDDGEAPPQKEVAEAYEKLAEKHFPLPPKPDEKLSYEYYQAHMNDYGIPAVTRLSEIYIKHPEGAGKAVVDAARERAKKIQARLAAGEQFSEVAAEETDNPVGKLTKGDIGFQQTEEIAWLKDAIKSLNVGGRTDLIETPTGFLILEVTDKRPALISPYANVRDKVMQALRDSGQKKQRDAYVRELAKTAKIEIIEPELKRLFKNGIFQ